MSTCELPRRAEEFHRAAYDVTALDLASASRFECMVGLYEHEQAGLRFETWPEAVRVLMERHVEEWHKKNPGATPLCVTTAVVDRACVMIVHHRKG